MPRDMHTKVVMELPGIELGHVNVYMVGDTDRVGLIDAGMADFKNVRRLLRALRAVGAQPSAIESVVVTHFHVDHVTMAVAISDMGSPDLYMGERDLQILHGIEDFFRGLLDMLKECGAPRDMVDGIAARHPLMRALEHYRELSELPWRALRDGDVVKVGGIPLTVLETPGHTPGHITLLRGRDLYSGDHVLPRITPNVFQYPLPGYNALGSYLASLERLAKMGLDVIYPAHGDELRTPHARIVELIAHHRERMGEVLGAIGDWTTVVDVARRIKWSVDVPFELMGPINQFFAVGETLAHLTHLEELGLAKARVEGGIMYWKRA